MTDGTPLRRLSTFDSVGLDSVCVDEYTCSFRQIDGGDRSEHPIFVYCFNSPGYSGESIAYDAIRASINIKADHRGNTCRLSYFLAARSPRYFPTKCAVCLEFVESSLSACEYSPVKAQSLTISNRLPQPIYSSASPRRPATAWLAGLREF
jgi:hypothetical protein